ncbi:MAG: diguanylate cyclase [Clostridium sp.]
MKVVNERYIIDSINSTFNSIVAYNAYDSKKQKKVVISFIENEDLLKKSIDYITNNFHVLKSLNMNHVTNIRSAKAVRIIDGTKLEVPSYMYITEYYGDRIDTDKYIKSADFYSIIELLLKLAITVNTLNHKGYYFNEIKKSDLIIYRNLSNKIDIKLKSIIAFEVEKISVKTLIKADSMIFPQGIEREGNAYEDYGNSKEFKMLIKSMVKEFLNIGDLSKDLSKLNSILESSDIQTKKELSNIITILSEISKEDVCEKYFIDSLSSIEENLDIIGRQNEVNKINKVFSEMMERRMYGEAVVFFGDVGSGKTKLLSTIQYSISNRFVAPVIRFKYDKEFDKGEIKKFLLNTLIATDKQGSEEYNYYISKFLELIDSKNYMIDRNESLRIINRVTKLIVEYSTNCPVVLIIDDVKRKDTFFYDFIKYLINRKENLKNILLIMSSVEAISSNSYVEAYKVDYLDEYESKVLIRRVLNTSCDINYLCDEIYKETLGNPSFIIEVIKEYYNQGILFFNKESGKWETTLKVDNITLPRSIERYIRDEVKYIEENEIEILQKLSIYQNALLEEIIISDIINNQSYLEAYNNLKVKGILIEKIGDYGILIDFSNLLTKKYIYMKILPEKRTELHKEASKIIEGLPSNYLDKYLEELLLHLEYSKQIKKFIYYSQRCATICESLANYKEAKKYYKRALKYCEKEDGATICLKIGDIHNNKGQKDKALRYYKLARDLAIEVNTLEILIYAQLSIGIILGRNGDVNKLKEAINASENNLNKVNFPKGTMLNYYAKAVYYFQTKKLDKSLAAIEESKKFSLGEYLDIEANIALITGCVYFVKRELKKSEECFKIAADFFEKDKYIDKYLTSQLNIGAIAEEVYQDSERAIAIYSNIIDIARKNKIHSVKFIVAINLSEIYIYSRKFKEAEELLLGILKDSREIDDGTSIVHAAFLLSDLYIRIGNIAEASKYINITYEYKERRNIRFDIYNEYNGFKMMYNLQLYKHDDIEIFSKVKNDKSHIISSLINRTTYYLILLYRATSQVEVEEIVGNITSCVNKIKKDDYKIDVVLSTIEVLYELGYHEKAMELYKNYKIIPKEENVQLKMAYIELLINKYSTSHLISKALRTGSRVNNPILLAKVYYLVGKSYENNKCYVQAFKYYYESLMIFKSMTNVINHDDVLYFVNKGLYLKVVNACIDIIKNKLGINSSLDTVFNLNTVEELYELNKKLEVDVLLGNTDILSLLHNNYDAMYFNTIKTLEDVTKSFTGDIQKNIEIIVRYISRVTLADKVSLTYTLKNATTKVMYSYGFESKDEIIRLSELKFNGDNAILSKEDLNVKSYMGNTYNIAKAIMYNKFTNRILNGNNSETVNGKIILISNSSLNNFNELAMQQLKEIEPLIIFLLNQYNLTVNSTLDKLTGVLNRKNLEEKIENQLDYSKENNKKFALILFDIDNFKGINDKYGHQVGDDVLKKLVNTVESQLSGTNILGRYGGEEFVILIEYTDEDDLIKKANKIREKVQTSELLGSRRDVTISMGVSLYPNHSLRSEELISKADQALYKAKSLGKNCVCCWDKALNNKSSFNNKLTGILTGDSKKDYDSIGAIMDILDISRGNDEKSIKISKTLEVIRTIIKSEGVKLIDNYDDDRIENIALNKKLISDVINNKKGLYTVDWDNLIEHKCNNYDWKSVCITPIIYDGEVKAVLYAWVSVNEREFNFKELNLMNMLGELLLPIL